LELVVVLEPELREFLAFDHKNYTDDQLYDCANRFGQDVSNCVSPFSVPANAYNCSKDSRNQAGDSA
jgi:hypothetical protein